MSKPRQVTRSFAVKLGHGFSSVAAEATFTLDVEDGEDELEVGQDAYQMARESALEDLRQGRAAHALIDAIVGGATRKLVGTKRTRQARGSGADEEEDFEPPLERDDSVPPPAPPSAKRIASISEMPPVVRTEEPRVVDETVPPPPAPAVSVLPPNPPATRIEIPAPDDWGHTDELFVDPPMGAKDVDWSKWDSRKSAGR